MVAYSQSDALSYCRENMRGIWAAILLTNAAAEVGAT
jgi:hypothetical protein